MNSLSGAVLRVLRHAEAHGTLTVADCAEHEALFADLDVDADAMAAEKVAFDATGHELARIADEEERLSSEARAYLDQLRQRSAALAEDHRRATGREIAPTR